MRVLGAERGWLVQGVAFTPYVAVASAAALVPVAVLGVRTRRWVMIVAAVAATVTLVGCVLPRSISDERPGDAADGTAPTGPRLRVMTSNLLFGRADVETLARLVATLRVDVLAVQELTPRAGQALDASDLAVLLPYREVWASDGAGGSALYSRLPLRAPGLRPVHDGFLQANATIAVPGAAPVELESVHTYAPVDASTVGAWRDSMSAQPKATPRGAVRVLLGDFNATLDHAALRRLIDSGYRDAASVVGAGFSPTWPFDGHRGVPPVTIDHVLADRRVGVRRVSVHPVRGSDHRAVFAELLLPAG